MLTGIYTCINIDIILEIEMIKRSRDLCIYNDINIDISMLFF